MFLIPNESEVVIRDNSFLGSLNYQEESYNDTDPDVFFNFVA
jgi:hypothetical protein